MDIALILAKIRPGAAWRMSGTYQELVDTWEDGVQVLPTLQELTDAEAGVLVDKAAIDDEPSLDEKIAALIANDGGDPAPLTAVNVRIAAAAAGRANLP